MYPSSYLKVLLPSIVISVSLILIIIQIIRRGIKARRKAAYQPVANGSNVFGLPGHHDEDTFADIGVDSEEEEEADEALIMGGGALTLARTITADSVVEVDRPRGQYL